VHTTSVIFGGKLSQFFQLENCDFDTYKGVLRKEWPQLATFLKKLRLLDFYNKF